jgi:hypothetical protein
MLRLIYNPDLKSAIHCVNNLDTAKVKFLGVLIDPNLNFHFHIKAISAKLSSALFHLRAVKSMLSQKALTALYYSLFHSHLKYVVWVWSSTAPSIIKELVKKQKQAIRIIQNAAYNAHNESLFNPNPFTPTRRKTVTHFRRFFTLLEYSPIGVKFPPITAHAPCTL